MPTYKTKTDIEAALKRFNERAYNAALSFRAYHSGYCLWVQASFDFAYYVNVDIECRHMAYTNIGDNVEWPDAWHADQLFLLSDDELEYIVDFKDIELDPDKTYFGIVFNIIGKENYFINGTVIFTELYIQWKYPPHED